MSVLLARNHYERLQVAVNASERELSQAYRRLAKKYHPDVAQEQRYSAAAFHCIAESYEVLSDPQKRRDYDRRLKTLRGFSERRMHGYRAGRALDPRAAAASRAAQARSRALRHNPALDVDAVVFIDLKKAFTGGEQKVNLVKAPETNYPLRATSVQVMIPKMCVEGSQIQVPLQGRYNALMGQAGHLNLKVEYAAHENFQIRGAHLYTSTEIYPWDAALGVSVPIDSPGGRVLLEVPQGTHQWRTFRMPDLGLPKLGQRRGDLYVYVKIKSVAAVTPEQIRRWKALKSLYSGEL